MKESELQAAVLEMAAVYGWKRFHALPAMNRAGQWRTAMAGDKGFPDLVLVSSQVVAFIELKSEKGRLSAEQKDWLASLNALNLPGVWAEVWKPLDWTSGHIERCLKEHK